MTLVCLAAIPIEKAHATEFLIDPKIKNIGPVLKLTTSDLPKAPLIMLKDNQIDWERPGVRIEQLRLVAEMVGVRFAYGRYPWKRALRVVEEGRGDAVFVAGYSKERAAWGIYPFVDGKLDTSRAISQVTFWLYTLRDGTVRWDGKNLTGVTGPIGADSGDLMTVRLKNEGLIIDEISTYRQMALMLAAGRIDAAIGFRSLIDKVIDEDPSQYEEIEKNPIPFRKAEGYLMFSKASYRKNTETIEKIWTAFQQLWMEGTMDMLFAKYQRIVK